MRQYADAVIAAKVCDQSVAELNALIRVFEGLFTEIETIAAGSSYQIAGDSIEKRFPFPAAGNPMAHCIVLKFHDFFFCKK